MSLTKTSELIVMRSYGMSVWKFLSPALFSAFFFGVLTVFIFNPIGLILLKKYERMEAVLLQGNPGTMSIGKNGIWLRDIKEDKIIIINALRIIQDEEKFFDVSFFITDKNYRFLERIDAKTAQLTKTSEWIIENATITKNDLSQYETAKLNLPTSIKFNQIQETFLPPETISVYNMPEFIRDMQASGFSTLKHSNYFFKTLASPFLYLSMVLIAINFATVNPRSGKVGVSVFTGIIFGFVIYFISDIINAVAVSGAIPVYIAAIAPTVICLCMGVYLTIHYEDG
jgi:lipopolysaccharide export system permease protein